MNASLLASTEPPVGDLAADMLLGSAISRDGFLLVGHYSRWQFNHPGPFWFYLNQSFEWLFASTNLRRSQIWEIGSLVLNAAFVTGGALAFSCYLLRRIQWGFVAFFVVLWIGFCGPEITSLWMPWRIVTPYLCFLIAVLHLSEGDYRALWPASFLTGVLIHGYITLPIFTLPIFLWALVQGERKAHFLRTQSARIPLIASGLTLFLMALPILIDAMGPSPTNLDQILETKALFRGMPKPDRFEILQFGRALLRLDENTRAWVGALSLLGLLGLWPKLDSTLRRRMKHTGLLSGAVTVAIGVYYSGTPSPLHPFVAQFFVVIPVLVLGTLGVPAFAPLQRALPRRWGVVMRLPVVVLTALLMAGLERPGKPVSQEDVTAMAEILAKDSAKGPVSLHYGEDQGWDFIAGLLLELERRGVNACTTRRDGEWVFTAFHLCSASTIPEFEVVPEGSCEKTCLYQGQGHGLRYMRFPVLSPNSSLVRKPSQALFLNWSESPEGIWWTAAKASSLIFQIESPALFEGVVDLNFTSLGPQRIKLSWNGQEIFNDRLSQTRKPLSISFPAQWIRPGPNALTFEVPDARRYSAEDQRTLALRFSQIRIR